MGPTVTGLQVAVSVFTVGQFTLTGTILIAAEGTTSLGALRVTLLGSILVTFIRGLKVAKLRKPCFVRLLTTFRPAAVLDLRLTRQRAVPDIINVAPLLLLEAITLKLSIRLRPTLNLVRARRALLPGGSRNIRWPSSGLRPQSRAAAVFVMEPAQVEVATPGPILVPTLFVVKVRLLLITIVLALIPTWKSRLPLLIRCR